MHMRQYRCLQICLWTALLALASPVAATQAADATTPAQIKGIGNDFDALVTRRHNTHWRYGTNKAKGAEIPTKLNIGMKQPRDRGKQMQKPGLQPILRCKYNR